MNCSILRRAVSQSAIRILLAALALTQMLTSADDVAAQTVRGTVTDGSSRQPLQGALVLLLDESGVQQGGALTSATGNFLIAAPSPGQYQLRAQRIGYSDGIIGSVALRQEQSVEHSMVLEVSAITLDGIAVQARRRCVVRAGDGQILGHLWQEARKALRAAAFTEGERLYTLDLRRHDRLLDPASLRVLRDSSVSRRTTGESSPFVSLPMERLLADGFIQQSPGGIDYFAPDAAALISDRFEEHYCFGLTASHPEHTEVVGITFAPAARHGVPAITGTFWLDRNSHELRWLDYRYTRARSPADEDHRIGGRVEFEPLPSGAWIVRRWWIRMPAGQPRQAMRTPAVRTQEIFGAILEQGGEVIDVQMAGRGSMIWAGGGLEGVVFDSLRAEPLRQALVFISGTSYSATTDSLGRFVVEPLPQGQYELSVSHPDLIRAGVQMRPHAVAIRGDQRQTLTIGIPRAARRDAVLETCPVATASSRPGVSQGRVVDKATGAALARARITFSWAEDGQGGGSVSTLSGPDGSFSLCGLPVGVPLVAQASYLGQPGSPSDLFRLDPLGFVQRELTVPLTRTETLVLMIRDWETAAPIVDALVSLPDLNRQARSDAAGRVRLEGVLQGQHRIEVNHLAYGTQRDQVVVASGATDLEMRLSPVAIAIEGVSVVVRSNAEEARRRSGTRQTLMLREDIAALEGSSRHLGDIARRWPGLRVREVSEVSAYNSEICIESSRGVMRDYSGSPCSEPVMVVVDGMPIFEPWRLSSLSPAEMESIEYLTAAEAGGRFGMGSARGVIIIYTRGNGPYAKR
ncbi:hypothetical protein BH23GEM6_BH23GEM6_12000 [soil metagenome]